MNGTAVDDRIGIILDLNACYPVAVDIVLLKQTLKEGKVEGERGREEVGGGGREGKEKERRREEGEEKERRREEGEEKKRRREEGGGRREGEKEGGGRREGEEEGGDDM